MARVINSSKPYPPPSNQDLSPFVDHRLGRPGKLTGPRHRLAPVCSSPPSRGGGRKQGERRGKSDGGERSSWFVVRFLEAVVNWIESGRIRARRRRWWSMRSFRFLNFNYSKGSAEGEGSKRRAIYR